MKARTLTIYDSLLSGFTLTANPLPSTVIGIVQELAPCFGEVNVVDYGCGVGVALLSLLVRARDLGLNVAGVGVDRGFSNSPDGCFPDTRESLQAVADRYSSSIFGTSCLPHNFVGISALFLRAPLDSDQWPMSPMSVHLAVSSKLVMFLENKFRFLERVWDSLAIGGVAVVEFDVILPGGGSQQTPRCVTPDSLSEILHDQRSTGRTIFGTSCLLGPSAHRGDFQAAPGSKESSRNSYIIAMRRQVGLPLRFPLSLKRCEAFRSSARARTDPPVLAKNDPGSL